MEDPLNLAAKAAVDAFITFPAPGVAERLGLVPCLVLISESHDVVIEKECNRL